MSLSPLFSLISRWTGNHFHYAYFRRDETPSSRGSGSTGTSSSAEILRRRLDRKSPLVDHGGSEEDVCGAQQACVFQGAQGGGWSTVPRFRRGRVSFRLQKDLRQWMEGRVLWAAAVQRTRTDHYCIVLECTESLYVVVGRFDLIVGPPFSRPSPPFPHLLSSARLFSADCARTT